MEERETTVEMRLREGDMDMERFSFSSSQTRACKAVGLSSCATLTPVDVCGRHARQATTRVAVPSSVAVSCLSSPRQPGLACPNHHDRQRRA